MRMRVLDSPILSASPEGADAPTLGGRRPFGLSGKCPTAGGAAQLTGVQVFPPLSVSLARRFDPGSPLRGDLVWMLRA